MNWNRHYDLEGAHAFLGASQHAWLNYSLDKLEDVWRNNKAKEKGTRLHAFASEAIELGIPLAQRGTTIDLFVNDCIIQKMQSEQVLYYSKNCFGTADAISFDSYENLLRIYDLKTGTTHASEKQLEIYAALFCLEYKYDPIKLNFELRLYQNNEISIFHPEPAEIKSIMKLIKLFDKKIETMKAEEL